MKLTNIKSVEWIDAATPDDVVVQTSMNEIEWNDFTAEEPVDARYIRMINTSDEEVTWTFE